MKKRNKPTFDISRLFSATNIVTILFAAILIYLVVNVLSVVLAGHTTSYQVTGGPLAKNQTYTGLVLRKEKVVHAKASGRITYYAADSSRVCKNGPVYSVHAGLVSEDDAKQKGSLRECSSEIRSVLGGFDPVNFREVYSLKSRLDYCILASATDDAGIHDNGLLMTNAAGDEVMLAEEDGIISYIIDGYEDFDIGQITQNTFAERRDRITELRPGDSVAYGEDVYKLVTSEAWSVLVPLTAKQVVHLEAAKKIRVKFLKDGMSQVADCKVSTGADGAFYARLDFSSGMLRYLSDRFLRVELVTNSETGLKVPLTSLTERSFLEIPDSFMTRGGDGTALGLMKVLPDVNSLGSLVFVKANIVAFINDKDELGRDLPTGKYYIEADNFSLGDQIAQPTASGQRMLLNTFKTLPGVYCINKGYAVFKYVDILDKNEDYCIVKKNTRYGISQFDFIVLDASTVQDSDITAA